MKQLLTIILIVIFNSTLWSTTIFVGVDSEKIVIWEYWKFEQGIGTNETLIYNPTDEVINVEFKKYHFKKQNWLQRLFTKNCLLKVKTLKPGDYILYKDFRSKIMSKSNGTIEVFINEKRIGLYGITKKSKVPSSKIQEGIIINQQLNSGRDLVFETVYNQLIFPKNSELNAEIKFVDSTFRKMGFPFLGDKNSDEITFNVIDIDNLTIEESSDYKLKFSSTGNLGRLKVTFTNTKSKTRTARFQCFYATMNASGSILFYIPIWLDFSDINKYVKI